MELKERILIDQDDMLLSYILADISQFKAPFQKVLTAYEALNIGEMTPAVFDEIKRGNARLCVMRYEKSLNDDLDRTKVYNPTLRSNLLQGTGDASRAFLSAVNAFLSTEVKVKEYLRQDIYTDAKLTIEFVSFKDGSLYISEESREEIAETHTRFFIEGEEEHQLYEAGKSIIENYKIVLAFGKKYNMSLNTSNMNCVSFLFKDVGESISINGRGIAGISKRMARYLKYRS